MPLLATANAVTDEFGPCLIPDCPGSVWAAAATVDQLQPQYQVYGYGVRPDVEILVDATGSRASSGCGPSATTAAGGATWSGSRRASRRDA